MFKHKILLFFALCLSLTTVTKAQDYSFRRITVDDGLVGTRVNCVCKDSRGLVWIGTNSGISCYDGLHFSNYQSHYMVPVALPDNRIQSIQEDADGTLWIRANESYVTMNPNTRLVDRAVSQRLTMLGNNLVPDVVFVDKNGDLWVYIAGKSLFYYKIHSRLIYSFEQSGDNTTLPEGTITGISDSPDGVVLVYADGQVVGISSEKQAPIWVNSVVKKNQGGIDHYKIFQDQGRNIWIYGDTHCFFYDEQTHIWYRSLAEFCQYFNMPWAGGADIVKSVTEDKAGNVWIATERNGLIRYSYRSHRAMAYTTSLFPEANKLSSNCLQSVYADANGGLWIGTQRRGLNLASRDMYVFESRALGDINGIAAETDSVLWLATTTHGLMRCNLTTGYTEQMGRERGLCDNVFSCVLRASNGSVWVGSERNGLSRMIGSSVTNFDKTRGLKDNRVTSIAEDMFGNVWIGTQGGGLQCYGAQTAQFSNFNVGNGKLPSNNVSSIATYKNTLIAGTDNGVVKVDLTSGQFSTIVGTRSNNERLTSSVVSAVCVDAKGMLWIGTAEGLNMLNTQTDELIAFNTESHGLPSNIICGIVADSQDNIWVTTDAGVCCLREMNDAQHPGTHNFVINNYTKTDGLIGTNFNAGSVYATKSGNVFLGSSDGLNYLHRKVVATGNETYSLILSSLYINGTLTTEQNSPKILSSAFNSCGSIALGNTQNDVRIEVTLSNYANHTQRPHITYLLEGSSDATWKPIQSDGHTIRLGRLSPGKYKLHIKAADENGTNIAEERVLAITVSRVWYKTWPFIITAIFLLVALFVFIMFMVPFIRNAYFRRMKEIAEYRLRRKQMEDKVNEIRQEAILIAPQLGLMQLEVKDPGMREKLQDMQHTIRGFVSKINELREDTSLGASKAIEESIGADVLIQPNEDTPKDNDTILIADDGVVQGNAFISDEGVIVERNVADTKMVIIDADQDMLDFMADCLKGTFDVRTFTDVEAAWQSIMTNPPHAIVCAHELGTASGSEFCHRVKSERSLENIPFVLTTPKVYTLSELDDNGVTMMADDYIPQPMNLKALIARVFRLLDMEDNVKDDLKNDETMHDADTMKMAAKLQLRKYVDDYVMQNISRKDLSIDELSRAIGVSRGMLFRRIESITGRVPADYIRAVRLQEVSKLLSSSTLTLSEIAVELGFVNAQTLSYYFKLEYGVLPTEYKDMADGIQGGEGRTIRQESQYRTHRS